MDALLNYYIPKKGDEIDEALANFINTFPEKEKIKIMFLREHEGVYTFGQRKVHVKVERGNQVFVRIGGGFLTFADFINNYTQSEITKIERNDVMDRFKKKVGA